MSLDYTLSKKKMKNIILKVKDGQIKVSAPFWLEKSIIDSFVESKREWIENQLLKHKNYVNYSTFRDTYIKGDKILILANLLTLDIIEYETNNIFIDENYLKVFYNTSSKKKVEFFIREWLELYIFEILSESTKKFSEKTNLFPNYIIIKNLKSAWGIYHKRKNYISYNIQLIEKSIEAIDYVVLHELCHIEHLNHQKGFWKLLEQYMPDYKIRIEELRHKKLF